MASQTSYTNPQPKRIKTTHKNPNQSQHPNQLPTIPEEVIAEILTRLPVKSLLRFRSVCKPWREFISNTHFVKSHLAIASNKNNHTHRSSLIISCIRPKFDLKSCSVASLFDEMSESPLSMDYPMKDPYSAVWVVGSCNGLVCVAIEEETVFLWNPSIRRWKELVDSGIKKQYGCYVIYGFGYDDSGDDYKMVRIFCFVGVGGSYKTEVKIYSLKDDSWRRIGGFPHGIPLDDSGKFANGFLHWAASGTLGSNTSWKIVSLDLSNDTYGEVAQPDYGEPCLNMTLGVLDGCLCVMSNYCGVRADVWVMKSYALRESWTKVAAIPYDPCVTDTMIFQYSAPLCLSKDGEILFEYASKLKLFNPKDGTFRDPKTQNIPECFEAHTYVESLVSPS